MRFRVMATALVISFAALSVAVAGFRCDEPKKVSKKVTSGSTTDKPVSAPDNTVKNVSMTSASEPMSDDHCTDAKKSEATSTKKSSCGEHESTEMDETTNTSMTSVTQPAKAVTPVSASSSTVKVAATPQVPTPKPKNEK